MNIFAEYVKLSNGKEFRKKTLLQFGDSTKLIGSAILINPGSSNPIDKIDKHVTTIKSFYLENHKINLTESEIDSWKVFNIDSTMRFLTKVFNGGYIGNETKLEGIIQLFNCSYYKEQDLELAKNHLEDYPEYNFNEHSLLSNAPVYFGWGDEGKNGTVNGIAKSIFSLYNLTMTPIYCKEFSDNSFYHPIYINRSYKSNPKTQKLLSDFYSLF